MRCRGTLNYPLPRRLSGVGQMRPWILQQQI